MSQSIMSLCTATWDAYADGPANPAGVGIVDAGPMSVYAEYTR